jgi:hypothetical protein
MVAKCCRMSRAQLHNCNRMQKAWSSQKLCDDVGNEWSASENVANEQDDVTRLLLEAKGLRLLPPPAVVKTLQSQ